MSTVQVSIPESLHRQLEELARREGVPLEQYIALAAAEKVSALLTEEYLSLRAGRGNRVRYEAALSQVPDVEPEPYDRRPELSTDAG